MRFSISTSSTAALVLFAVGCGTTTNPDQAGLTPTDESRTAPAANSEPSPKPSPDAPPTPDNDAAKPAENMVSPIRITPAGVGPLRSDTNPDKDLKGLFPQHEIVADSFQAEGNTYTVYRLLEEGKPVLLIQPWEGRVAEVMILYPSIHGPHGIHVGATLEELSSEALSKLGACFFAAEGQEKIFCGFDDASRLQLTFSTDGMKVESLRPVEVEELAGRAIQGLRWLPRE